MKTFKVEKDGGVDIDGAHFEKGELVELDAESLIVADFVTEGSLAVQEAEEETPEGGDEVPGTDETPVSEDEPAVA